MSEFVDPIKRVKKKVQLLDEASKIIKSSLRQQLEHQREIKGLEVAKTEEYAKQAKPIVEAVGTQPSAEEKLVAKQNDRNIVISSIVSDNLIPTYDPSYNIIIKYFDDSYDIIKSRKTDSLKQRDIDMMVSSIQSLVNIEGMRYRESYGSLSPISSFAKNIYEKIFLSKDYTLSDSQKADIVLQEGEIVDREQTEAEKTQVEAERKIQEEKKQIDEESKKRAETESEEKLARIEEENKSSMRLRDLMFGIFQNRLNEQGLKSIDINNDRDPKAKLFKFIHPLIITETNPIVRSEKIQGLFDRPNVIKAISVKNKDKVKNAFIRTYTNEVVNYSSTKSASDSDFNDSFEKLFARSKAPVPPEEKAPAPEEKAPEILKTPEKVKIVEEEIKPVEPLPETKAGEGPLGIEKVKFIFDSIRDDMSSPKKSKEPYKKLGIMESVLESKATENGITYANDIIYFKILGFQKYINAVESLMPTGERGTEKPSGYEGYKIKAIAKIEELKSKLPAEYLGFGLKIKKSSKGGFVLPVAMPFPFFGKGKGKKKGKGFNESYQQYLTSDKKMDDIIRLRNNIRKDITGKGLSTMNQKNFEKKMKKKSNEDLLHNLQVHMAEVQAGNNGLKEPIKMIVSEAYGRGIMKKNVANKIIKNFSN